jgi:RHS repeat-associated protein
MTSIFTHRLAIAIGLAAATGAGPVWAASATRTTSFAYDSASGMLNQEVIEPATPALELSTTYTLDAYGNRVGAMVSGGGIATRSSSVTYDGQHKFPIGTTNALGQSENWTFDQGFGLPTSNTDANGLTTSWSYDTFGRKTLETRSDGTQVQYTYAYCSGVNGGTATCPTGAAYQVQITPLSQNCGATCPQIGRQTTRYHDQLNREIAIDTQGFDGSLSRIATQYDALGRIAQTSKHYFIATGTPKWTSYTYDALARVLTRTAPDGSTTQTAYHGLTVVRTDALGNTRTTVKNDQGLVASVTDALNNTIRYSYDPFGNLTQTTDPVGNVTTASYDTRGRTVAADDPDLGSWQYSYDALNEPLTQIDAKGQIVTFQYDVLGRPVQRVEPETTTSWTYDPPGAVGQPASVATAAGYLRSYSYDGLARPSAVTITTGGASFSAAATYDSTSGRLSTLTYPSGFAVAYSYNSFGFTTQLTNVATGLVYWTANQYSASLRLKQQTAGNGVVTTLATDPNTGNVTAIQAGLTASEVANYSYQYDSVRNVLARGDINNGLAESFTYDKLYRVTSAVVTEGPSKSFVYDATGNLTLKSDVGTYSYPAPGSAQPHAVQSASGAVNTSFTYDANGNLVSGAGRTIGYTSFNLPNSIVESGTSIAFTHDPDHQRLTQQAPEGTTTYLSGLGLPVDQFAGPAGFVQWNEYLAVDGQVIGVRFERSDGTAPVRYFHTDTLGSVSTLTQENGTVVEQSSFDAWGKRRFANGQDDPLDTITSQTTRGYTGHETLQDVALVHMNGRVYDPLIGRFTSADPTLHGPHNDQNWNRYAYVRNNPLNRTDPSGFCDDPPDPQPTPTPEPAPQPDPTTGPDAEPRDVTPATDPSTNPNSSGTNLGNWATVTVATPGVGDSFSGPLNLDQIGAAGNFTVGAFNAGNLGLGDGAAATTNTYAYLQGSNTISSTDVVNATLFGASFVPGPVGALASLGQAGLSLREGDYIGAGISTFAAVLGTVSDAGAINAALRGARFAANEASSAVKVFNNFHHPIPKFLGGDANQFLVGLESSVHVEFHSLLRTNLGEAGIPLNIGGRGGSAADWANYMTFNPGAQITAFNAVLGASRSIDVKYGTSITQSVWGSIMNGHFARYP